MRLSLGRKKENKKIATKANARLITSDETNLLVLSEPSSGLVIFLPGVLSMGSSNICLASLSAMVSLPSLSHCKRTKGTKNVSCFRAIRATQTSRAAIFLVLLVVGSAVQKKRGHQRGVAREGPQQSKK